MMDRAPPEDVMDQSQPPTLPNNLEPLGVMTISTNETEDHVVSLPGVRQLVITRLTDSAQFGLSLTIRGCTGDHPSL